MAHPRNTTVLASQVHVVVKNVALLFWSALVAAYAVWGFRCSPRGDELGWTAFLRGA